MPDIIREKDRNGVIITCSEAQWETHIVANHQMMADNIDAVRRTIVDPDYIFESHDSNPPLDDRRIYSKEVTTATYHKKAPYTKVIVSIGGGYGEIVTAFPARNPQGGSNGGEALYSASNKPTV